MSLKIPLELFEIVATDNGKPDAIGIVLLSDFLTKEDGYFRTSYQEMMDKFYFTKRQVRDACKRLSDAGLITLDFRITKIDGILASNVLFVKVNKPITKSDTKPLIEMEKVSPKGKGYIYFIKASNNAIKIGLSKNVEKRMKSIRTQTPFAIELLFSIPTNNMKELEEELHDLFNEKRLHGEWFDLTYDDLEYVKQKYLLHVS